MRNGSQEVIYQRALEWNLLNRNILFAREVECQFFTKDVQIGTSIENKISVELNDIIQLEDVQLAQAKNYLEHIT